MLFQKRVVCTKFDLYVFIIIIIKLASIIVDGKQQVPILMSLRSIHIYVVIIIILLKK